MKKGVRVERARGAEGCGKEMRAGHADAAAAAHAARSGRRERRGARQRRRPRRRRRAAVQAIQAWRATVASRSSRVRWPSRRPRRGQSRRMARRGDVVRMLRMMVLEVQTSAWCGQRPTVWAVPVASGLLSSICSGAHGDGSLVAMDQTPSRHRLHRQPRRVIHRWKCAPLQRETLRHWHCPDRRPLAAPC